MHYDVCAVSTICVYDGQTYSYRRYDGTFKTIFTCNRFVVYNCYFMVAYETVRELRNRRRRRRCLSPVIATTSTYT